MGRFEAPKKGIVTSINFDSLEQDSWIVEHLLSAMDFNPLQAASGLSFDNNARLQISRAALAYIMFRRADESVPAKAVESKLRSIISSCKELSSILHTDLNSDPVNQAAFWYSVPGRNCPDSVTEFLSKWVDAAEAALRTPGKRGRKRNDAMRRFLACLRKAYESSGGQGVGCYRDRETGAPRGQFLALAVSVLEQIGSHVPSTQIADYILKPSE